MSLSLADALIDVHHHLLTDRYLAAMRSAGITNVEGFPIPSWSLDTALELMDRCRISAALLSISAPGINFVHGENSRRLARELNEEQARFVGQHPTRLGALAILPLPDVDAALNEISYALDTIGLDGIVLFSNIAGIYLGDQRFDAIFDELHRRKAVIFVHPVAPPDFDMTRLGFAASAIEYPFDTTRMIMNLIASGTLRRCPSLRIIVAHGGGTLPFLVPRITRNLTRFGKVSPPLTPEEVAAAFRSFYFDVTAVSHRHSIDALLTLAPADRLLYGSDHPFMIPSLIPAAIEFLNTDPRIDSASRQAVTFQNALALFPALAARMQ